MLKHERAALRPHAQDEAGFATPRGCRRRSRHRHQQDRLPNCAARASGAAGRAATAQSWRAHPRFCAYCGERHEGRRRSRPRGSRADGAPGDRHRREHGQGPARIGCGIAVRWPAGQRALRCQHRSFRRRGHRWRHHARLSGWEPPFPSRRGAPCPVRAGRAWLHSLPIGYSLAAVTGIREPRGMLGNRFGVDMHMVTSDVAIVRNLILVVERSHLSVEAMVASPYASGLSVLADDEGDLGAATIDLGAGTTTMAVFSSGKFVHADGFALGGHHVTMDLARGLNTRIVDAERIKAIYGSVLTGGWAGRDMITVAPVGDDERESAQFVSRAALVRIIKPRVEEILEMVRDRLKTSPFAADPRAARIFTGGTSQLAGIVELAARILHRPVRIGRPLGLAGVTEAAQGHAPAPAQRRCA